MPLTLNKGFWADEAAGGTPSDPSEVTSASLKLWLRADTLALTNGDPVTTWPDSSGNGNNATANGDFDPVYRTNQVNSLPAVDFGDLGIAYFDLPDFCSGFTAGEVFIVLKRDEDPTSDIAVSALWSFGTDNVFGNHVPYTDGNVYDDWGRTARVNHGSSGGQFAAWSFYSIWSATNDYQSFINGSGLFSTGTNTVAFRSNPKLGFSVVGDYILQGLVAEMFMFNGKLSTDDRLAMNDYVIDKFNISV